MTIWIEQPIFEEEVVPGGQWVRYGLINELPDLRLSFWPGMVTKVQSRVQ